MAVAGAITPLDGVPPFELFGGATDEAWRSLHLEGREACPFLGRYLPSLTGDPEFEESMVGVSGTAALHQGFQIYEVFKGLYEKYAGPLFPENRVLDFGCGWGRVIRFFLREVAPDNLIGLDTYEPALAACRKTNRWSNFLQCEVLPPTELKSASFDLIYAFSVFSHLSEEAHWRWLEEFKRILRPTGVLVLTTFQRDFLATGRPSAGEAIGPSLEESLAAYDRGDFSYRSLQEVKNPHFGDAYIPEPYVREHWSKLFKVEEYSRMPEKAQNIIVCTHAG